MFTIFEPSPNALLRSRHQTGHRRRSNVEESAGLGDRLSNLGIEYPPFRHLVLVLSIAALLEFVLIRIFSRMGILLPKDALVFSIYSFVIFIGSAIFNLASILVLLALALAVILLLPRRGTKSATLPTAIILLLVFSIALLVVSPTPLLSLSYDVVSVIVVASIAIGGALRSRRTWTRLMFSLIGAAYLSTYYFKIVPLTEQVFSIRQDPGFVLNVFNLGEAFAVLASFPILATFGLGLKRPQLRTILFSRQALVSTLAVFVFAGSYLRNPWITSIIATWTVGFTLYLPLPVYLTAIWAFTYSLAKSWSDDRLLFSSLLLIPLGGRMLQLTYLTLMAVLGLVIISRISALLEQIVVEKIDKSATVEIRRPLLRRV